MIVIMITMAIMSNPRRSAKGKEDRDLIVRQPREFGQFLVYTSKNTPKWIAREKQRPNFKMVSVHIRAI